MQAFNLGKSNIAEIMSIARSGGRDSSWLLDPIDDETDDLELGLNKIKEKYGKNKICLR